MPVNVDEFIKDWLSQKSIIVNKIYKIPHYLLKEILIRYNEICNTEQSLPIKGAKRPPEQDEPRTPSGGS